MNNITSAPTVICCIQEPDGNGGSTYFAVVIYLTAWLDFFVDGVLTESYEFDVCTGA